MINKTELRTELNKEWAKPKSSNLKVIDSREPRDYKKIKELQDRINAL